MGWGLNEVEVKVLVNEKLLGTRIAVMAATEAVDADHNLNIAFGRVCARVSSRASSSLLFKASSCSIHAACTQGSVIAPKARPDAALLLKV